MKDSQHKGATVQNDCLLNKVPQKMTYQEYANYFNECKLTLTKEKQTRKKANSLSKTQSTVL